MKRKLDQKVTRPRTRYVPRADGSVFEGKVSRLGACGARVGQRVRMARDGDAWIGEDGGVLALGEPRPGLWPVRTEEARE